MNEPALDFLNREIKVGDTCVYPVRRGSKLWMNRLNVQRISHNLKGEPAIHGVKGDGYPVTIKSLDRVTIIGRNSIVPNLE